MRSYGLRLARIAFAALLCVASGAALAADSMAPDYPDAPKPQVQVNLSAGLVNDLLGVGDAAVSGVARAMSEYSASSGGSGPGEAAKVTAEQLAAAQQIVGMVKGSINGVQLRVYRDLDDAAATKLADHYQTRLATGGWEPVVQVEENGKRVQVALSRGEGAVRGAFVVAVDSGETATVHVDCDFSPEKIEQLTGAVTKTALDMGLGAELEKAVKEIREEMKH